MKLAFVGCGYVFDIYMRTRWAYPEMDICGVFDIDKKNGGMSLKELAPGVTLDEIKSKTEATFKVPNTL